MREPVDYTKEPFYKCYSRRVMYYLGIHNINYKDKFYDITGRPYWLFENNERFREVMMKWNDFKKTL